MGGRAVHITGRGGFLFAPLLVGSGKEGLEVCPRLVVRRSHLPVLAVLDEHSCLENDLESVGDDLERGVGIVACIPIFDGILDLFEYPFDGLVYIVGCLLAGVVLDELGGDDAGVRRV